MAGTMSFGVDEDEADSYLSSYEHWHKKRYKSIYLPPPHQMEANPAPLK